MTLSKEVGRLSRAWQNETAWPKRLEWIEVSGLRGWRGQRIRFPFPIVAIAGENGSGKSTIIQACAAAYQKQKSEGSVKQKGTKYASDFFPNTYWDQISEATIAFGYSQAGVSETGSIRKPTERWNGNPDRPIRKVEFFDLSRILPVGGRVGYARIAKSKHTEASATQFDQDRLDRLSNILGHKYRDAKMATARMADGGVDEARLIPVLQRANDSYSGYHQGQGETTIAELIQADLPKYSLVLIDEIESSLHPRAQRRLIRDLAEVCRLRELQIILTTHSPYVLEELPKEARIQIFDQDGDRKVMIGVSPEFALSKMDENDHPECELYVEDDAARTWLQEILSQKLPDLAHRVLITTSGAASVGYQLGIMVSQKRFNRPTGVFLDGDCKDSDGCCLLPGEEAPERVVFEALSEIEWGNLWTRLVRDVSVVSDACNTSLALSDHHDWVAAAAKKLLISGNILWHYLCAEWVNKCMSEEEVNKISQYIEDCLAETQ